MRILFLSTMFYPEVISGGQISSFFIVKTLKKLGHDVTVITLTKEINKSNDVIDGINIIRIPYKSKTLIQNMELKWIFLTKLVLTYIKKLNPEIIHLLNFEPVILVPIIIKLFYKNIPIVTTVNGPLFGCFIQSSVDYKGSTCVDCKLFKRSKCSIYKYGKLKGLTYYLYSLYYMSLLRISYKSIDKFFAVSNAMIILLTNMGVNEKNIEVIYNPIGRPNVRFSITKLKAKYGIKNKKMILFAGRQAKEKGIGKIIEAIKDMPNVHFFIVGNKSGDHAYFLKLSKDLGISERIRFLGFKSHKDLQELYLLTDLVVLPETFFEPLSRLLLEAASYGIPLIATKVGGNEEIIENNKNGYLLESIDDLPNKIKEILNNKLKAEKFGIYSKNKIRNLFSEKIVGKKLEEQYFSLLK